MSYHHKSGAQKRREKAMRTEGVLNEEDLLEIEEEPEEVPRSEPDIDAAGCSGWTEGPETPDAEALVVVAGVYIGIFIKGEVPTMEEVEEAVRCSKRFPLQFPNDSSNREFPNTILCYKLPNGEDVHRDWLVWSESKQALFCFPCRLFTPSSNMNHSLLLHLLAILRITSGQSYTTGFQNIKKALVIKKYVAWRNFQKVIGCSATISCSAIKQKYRERNCNMEGTVAQNSTSCFVPWRKGLGIQR